MGKKVVFFLLCDIFKEFVFIHGGGKSFTVEFAGTVPRASVFRSTLPLFRRMRENLRLLRYRADFLRKKSIPGLFRRPANF